MNNTESTNNEHDAYLKWADSMKNKSDMEVSRAIFERIAYHSDIDEGSKKVLIDAYEYCVKLINQGKPLEPDLLKIYLQQVKGYKDVSQINIVNLIAVLGMCGIIFK